MSGPGEYLIDYRIKKKSEFFRRFPNLISFDPNDEFVELLTKLCDKSIEYFDNLNTTNKEVLKYLQENNNG